RSRHRKRPYLPFSTRKGVFKGVAYRFRNFPGHLPPRSQHSTKTPLFQNKCSNICLNICSNIFSRVRHRGGGVAPAKKQRETDTGSRFSVARAYGTRHPAARRPAYTP